MGILDTIFGDTYRTPGINPDASMPTQQSSQPRYQIVSSQKFYGCYDVLDTHTGKREACGNLRTARATIKSLCIIK